MFLLNVKASYDSAHFLRNYKGKCENLHGHHYVVEAGLAYEDVGPGGMAMDFTDAKRVLRAIANELDHNNINDLEPFTTLEPSAENQARWIFEEMQRRLGPPDGDHLVYVRVWETPNQWAQYSLKPTW
ncbi:MAG TPA: 6-carboxytetrahydropterin synthase [Longimicrobium sp.]|nr:6-carboxytetrahydropterin synthase [Longimicrobium sp.]HYW11924.1 6-carboxytetrahydropterin synthase [Longimicrobium sp.]